MEASRKKILHKVGEWLARADADLQSATHALTMQAQAPRACLLILIRPCNNG